MKRPIEDLLEDRRPSLIRRILGIPVEIVVGLYVVIDGLVAPLFGPLVRWLSTLKPIQRLERAVGSLPPYVILVLLGVPFGIAELTKVYAVILMAEDHFRLGMTMFIGAYVVSILVCERTFHAGKAQLLTIAWFKVLYDWVMAIRDHILAFLRRTRVWRMADALRQRARVGFRRTRIRLRSAFGIKPQRRAREILERR